MKLNQISRFLTLSLAIVTLSFAKNPLSIDQSINQFIKKSEGFQMNNHRTGLLNGSDQLFADKNTVMKFPKELESEEMPDNLNGWFTNNLPDFKVVYPTISSDISKFYKKNLNSSALDIEKTEDNGEVWVIERSDQSEDIVRQKLWKSPPSLSLDDLKKAGIKIVRKYLGQFSGKIEYENYEVEYEGIEGKQVITEVSIRFRRIFNGGAILRNVSFLYVTLDGYGEVRRIKIKWPTFEKIANEAKSTNTINKALLKASEISENQGPYRSSNGESIYITNILLTGMARGWLIVPNGEDQIITPAYSFIQKAVLGNGDESYRYLDIPIDTKYEVQ